MAHEFITVERQRSIKIIMLNRPEVLNAWHEPMRLELLAELRASTDDDSTGAVVLTGAGNQAFCAGQDLEEARKFDPKRAVEWIEEWRVLYDAIRTLYKPVVTALNGLAAGSAFQVTLLTDYRVGHDQVTMGQPEINSGIVSTLGFWILREMVGLSRAIELIMSGRMVSALECERLGLMHRIVPRQEVLTAAIAIAEDLAAKPRIAMRINKQRVRQVTQAGFDEAFRAASGSHHESFESGEPHEMIERFYDERAGRR